MDLAAKILAINDAIQGCMESKALTNMTADEAAEVVYAAGIISPAEGPKRGFAFREFIRMIRDRFGYAALYELLGVSQGQNQEHHPYTVARFNPPPRERIVEILKSVLPKLPLDDQGSASAEGLPDYLEPGLDIVFVGTSVGKESAKRNHYYSHPTNRFWDLVTEAKIVSEIVGAENDHLILEDKCGLTDLAKKKVSSTDAKLGKGDFDIEEFRAKLSLCKPKIVAFNGKRAFKEVFGHEPKGYGVSDEDLEDSFVFVLPSSSGSDINLPYGQKLKWYEALKAFLQTL